jgi:hypothetical protein
MKSWALGLLLAGLSVLTAWGVWHVVVACGIYGLAAYLENVPHAGWYATASMFVAGAAMGALAYHGEAALLFVLIWLAVMIWIEITVRHWLSDLFG